MFVESSAYNSKATSQQMFHRAPNPRFAVCSWCEEHAEKQAVSRAAKAVFGWNAWMFNLGIFFKVRQNMSKYETQQYSSAIHKRSSNWKNGCSVVSFAMGMLLCCFCCQPYQLTYSCCRESLVFSSFRRAR